MRLLARTAVLAGLLLIGPVAQAADTKEVHRTLPLDRDGRVLVHTYKGSVNVTTWDRPEVRIDARIEPDGMDSDQARKVSETEVRITGSGGLISIRSDYDGIKNHHGLFGIFSSDWGTLPFVHYTIQMPASAQLEIEDHKSDIQVSDLKADLKLHTYKGTAKVSGLDGAARLETYKGEVGVSFARFSRDSRFETYKGEIEVRLPKDSRFALDADAGRRGDIQTDFAMTTRASRSWTTRVSGAVNGGGPRLRLTTYKGTLRIRAS
jgi:Toastrack DUF4097